MPELPSPSKFLDEICQSTHVTQIYDVLHEGRRGEVEDSG